MPKAGIVLGAALATFWFFPAWAQQGGSNDFSSFADAGPAATAKSGAYFNTEVLLTSCQSKVCEKSIPPLQKPVHFSNASCFSVSKNTAIRFFINTTTDSGVITSYLPVNNFRYVNSTYYTTSNELMNMKAPKGSEPRVHLTTEGPATPSTSFICSLTGTILD